MLIFLAAPRLYILLEYVRNPDGASFRQVLKSAASSCYSRKVLLVSCNLRFNPPRQILNCYIPNDAVFCRLQGEGFRHGTPLAMLIGAFLPCRSTPVAKAAGVYIDRGGEKDCVNPPERHAKLR